MKRISWIALLGLGAFLGGTGLFSLPFQLHPASAQSQSTTGFQPAPNDPLLSLSDRFEQVAQKVLPSVVSVEAIKPPKGTGANKKPQEESGSGLLVHVDQPKPGYYVLTNNHVISGARNDQITLHLADGRIFRPTQTWTDPETDIALMQIDGTGLPAASLGNSDNAKVGRWVLAIGSPFGLNQTVTHGIISARDRGQVSLGGAIRIKEFLQTDAAINPGSSGGPLIDLHGEVVGINTAIASHSGSNSGVAFSIPINLVKRVMGQMLAQGAIQRGYLGMQLSQGFEPNDALRLGLAKVQGALVEKVYPDTPAATSGLKPQDVILSVESVEIRNENHLINLISGLPIGQRIRMQVWRDRGNVTLEAVVGDWSKAQTRFRAE
jgi:S1-C subfamily serine protease